MSTTLNGGAVVTYHGPLDMQVCVPAHWTDEQVLQFAEAKCPCGTECGWQIRRDGNPRLAGDKERVQCKNFYSRVHIMLDA